MHKHKQEHKHMHKYKHKQRICVSLMNILDLINKEFISWNGTVVL